MYLACILCVLRHCIISVDYYKIGLLPNAVGRSKNPLVSNQGSSTSVVEAGATFVLERGLENKEEIYSVKKNIQKSSKTYFKHIM